MSITWRQYLYATSANQWHPINLMPRSPVPVELSSEVKWWIETGVQNELDALNLFTIASTVANSEAWVIYSNYWLRDEILHGETFRMAADYCKQKEYSNASIRIRDRQPSIDFYSLALRQEVDVWAVLALDEFKTAKEYSTDGVAVFSEVNLGSIMKVISKDEWRHYAYSLLGLSQFSFEEINSSFEHLVSLIKDDLPSMFLFDHIDNDMTQEIRQINRQIAQIKARSVPYTRFV